MNHKTIKRLLAVLALLFFAGTVISLLICIVKGSEPGVILAHLFCLMVVPCIFYIFGKFTKKDKN